MNNFSIFNPNNILIVTKNLSKVIGGTKSYANFNKNFNATNPIDTIEIKEISDETRIKNICVSTLSGNNPCETMVVYDQDENKIINKYKGDKTSCRVFSSDLKSKSNNLVIFHGHPDIEFQGEYFYTPISFDDFMVLNSNKSVKEIIAYGKRGEKTTLKKCSNFTPLRTGDIEQIKKDIMKKLYKHADSKTISKVKELNEYCEKHPNNSNAVLNQALKLIQDIALTPNGAIAINEFWKQNASMYNMEYSSNI